MFRLRPCWSVDWTWSRKNHLGFSIYIDKLVILLRETILTPGFESNVVSTCSKHCYWVQIIGTKTTQGRKEVHISPKLESYIPRRCPHKSKWNAITIIQQVRSSFWFWSCSIFVRILQRNPLPGCTLHISSSLQSFPSRRKKTHLPVFFFQIKNTEFVLTITNTSMTCRSFSFLPQYRNQVVCMCEF